MAGPTVPEDRCTEAIQRLEQVAVAPQRGTGWRLSVWQSLRALRDALLVTSPPTSTPSTGPYAEVCRDAPRLSHALRRLSTERENLTRHLDGLLADSQQTEPALLERGVRQIVSEVRAYRRRISDLLHQAYTVDIGGEM